MKFLISILYVFLCVASAEAAEVYLKDGSVVAGTLLSLTDGEDLTVDTAHMDEVVIDWSAITRIVDTQIVAVELFDGRRYFGRLEYGEDGLAIIGEQILQVAAVDVYLIEELNESFAEKLSANTDLGFNIVRGNNTVTQLSLGAGVGYDAENFETAANMTTIINEQIDGEDTRRATLSANYTQKLKNRWQAAAIYQFESDEQQNLNARSIFGGTIGRYVFNRRTQRLEMFAGLAVNSENFDNAPSEESLEGILGTRYRLRKLADFDATLVVFPSLEENDRVRVQFDASLSFDLFSDFDFKTTVYDRYDSQPPAGNEKNDYGVTLGLSWSY
jgi:putative salt-induced outer membrane protein YdiY